MDDLLIRFGAEVKALGNGRIAGYLVRFSGESDPDLSGEFFTAATDFDTEFPGKTTLYYNHGIDATLGKRKLAKAEVKADEVGIWLEATLAMRDEYEQALYRLAEEGKMGLSSGAASHLVEKKQAGAAVQILSWPLAEGSLTPTPCEPRNSAVALKTWRDEAPRVELKAAYLGEYTEAEMTMAALRSLNDRLFYGVVWDALYDDRLTQPEKIDRLKAAFGEFGDIALRTITALMGDPEATASIKTLWASAPTGEPPPAGEQFATHSQSVLAAVSELTARARGLHELRVKSGRVFSAANRERLAALHESMGKAMADLKALLEETTPAEPGKSLALRHQRVRLAEIEARLIGVV